MVIRDRYTFSIASHFICAIEYDDFSGLDDTEESSLKRFTENELDTIQGSKVFEYSEDVDFTDCEICGLKADCVTLTVLILE